APVDFDHPSPNALAQHLIRCFSPIGASIETKISDDQQLRDMILAIPVSRLRTSGLLPSLLKLNNLSTLEPDEQCETLSPESVEKMDLESLVNYMTRRPDRK
ncbi:hypothetical protein, partial [Mycobacterium kansasii]|uniref:hypothetical protein n=1 Tax=Mycobacterium kansasii TaxID=1768 RepID=UPI00195D5C79